MTALFCFDIVGKYKIFRIEKSFTVGVSHVCKMFHAPQMMASFTG
ncbi:MAG: hypothetical protein PWP61_35 [Trichococcus sp.]|jgi:hypothetical protein|nr:hypothetical protein [Trichococcus sp.]